LAPGTLVRSVSTVQELTDAHAPDQASAQRRALHALSRASPQGARCRQGLCTGENHGAAYPPTPSSRAPRHQSRARGRPRGRPRIDKATLREWREDFAQAMRAQGIAANATPRAWRGQNKRPPRDSVHWADKRSDSYRLRKQVRGIAAEIAKTGTYRDPAGPRLAESRKAVLASWQGIAKTLDDQGEIELAGSVRYFVSQFSGAHPGSRKRIFRHFCGRGHASGTATRREILSQTAGTRRHLVRLLVQRSPSTDI
jgi:hypothetical protein